MKALHVISTLEMGGAQRLLSCLVPAQIQMGDEVEVLVYHRLGNSIEQSLEKEGVIIRSLGVRNIRSPFTVSGIRRVLKKGNYDVVYVHLFPALYQVALASRGLDIKLAYTEHSTSNRRRTKRWLRPLERMIYSCYDALIAVSEQTALSLRAWIGEKTGERIRIVANGIDLREFCPSTGSKDRNYILMVSRFVEAKAQDTLIKAIQYISCKDVDILFVGDGERLETMKALAEGCGVSHRCSFLGERENVADLMKRATIGVQTSNWEGFGITMVEFMGAGVPIVATDLPSLRETGGTATLYYSSGDEKSLAEAVNSLLENPTLYALKVSEGLERSRRYDIAVTAKGYHPQSLLL